MQYLTKEGENSFKTRLWVAELQECYSGFFSRSPQFCCDVCLLCRAFPFQLLAGESGTWPPRLGLLYRTSSHLEFIYSLLISPTLFSFSTSSDQTTLRVNNHSSSKGSLPSFSSYIQLHIRYATPWRHHTRFLRQFKLHSTWRLLVNSYSRFCRCVPEQYLNVRTSLTHLNRSRWRSNH